MRGCVTCDRRVIRQSKLAVTSLRAWKANKGEAVEQEDQLQTPSASNDSNQTHRKAPYSNPFSINPQNLSNTALPSLLTAPNSSNTHN